MTSSTGGSWSQKQIKLHSGTEYRSRTSHPKIDHMHYQANAIISGDEWLFGTTRDVEQSTRGSMIFIWRIDLDSNHDPRSTNMKSRWLDDSFFGTNTYVTGLRP